MGGVFETLKIGDESILTLSQFADISSWTSVHSATSVSTGSKDITSISDARILKFKVGWDDGTYTYVNVSAGDFKTGEIMPFIASLSDITRACHIYYVGDTQIYIPYVVNATSLKIYKI